ncbi:MAG: hypothetical protein IJ863_03605 [Spirochaetales bacterium]|nr:hypothetical protein [Spirochaetales bacterium]
MKTRKVLTTIVAAIALLVVLYSLFLGFKYNRFYRVSDKLQKIPGLMEGFVPQGTTRLENGDTWLVCGYMGGGKASRIYRLDGNGGVSVIYLQKEDGSTYTGHAGGITAAGGFVYISNASKLFVLRAEDVLNAGDGDTLSFIGHIKVPCRASFCSSDGEMVYVGDYHAKGYETADNHVIRVSDGKVHEAVTYGYRLGDGEFGVADAGCPSIAFSTCDKVQGFAVADGKAYLSCSAGFADSKLRVYQAEGSDGSIQVDGREVPQVMLDSNRAADVLTMPNRSEDIDVRDGLLYVGFEGGARKFAFGIYPFSLRSIMAVDLKDL